MNTFEFFFEEMETQIEIGPAPVRPHFGESSKKKDSM